MKGDKWLSCLQSALLTFLLGFSSLACLATAFDLHIGTIAVSAAFKQQIPFADLTFLAVWCGSLAVIFSLCYTLKLELVPLCALALLGGYLWQTGTLSESLEALVRCICAIYDKAYGIGTWSWTDRQLLQVHSTPALCAMATCIIPVCAWTVCRRKRSIAAVIVSFLPLAACLVVTDTVPDKLCLFLWLLGIVVLTVCQSTRRADMRQGNRLAAMVTIPAALALALLFWAIPQETYQGQQRADQILAALEQIFTGEGTQGEIVSTVSGSENLSSMGYLYNPHTPVMDVTAQTGGRLYLREQGFDSYTGTSWINSKGIDIQDWVNSALLEPAGSVTIQTRNTRALMFVPYYAWDTPMGGADGITENTQRLQSYTFTRLILSENEADKVISISGSPGALSLPESTLTWAEPLAMSIIEGLDTTSQQAQAIANFVRSSASYSKMTPRMSSSNTDFAQWFLMESDTGYCVHFATATAVLLRAAGINAQYVTGYTVDTQAGVSTTVYRDDAHAWVEYYLPGTGWMVLESTPADGIGSVPAVPQETEADNTAATGSASPQSTGDPATEPSAGQAQQTEPSKTPSPSAADSSRVWAFLKNLGAIAAAVFLILGQWKLRVSLRKRRLQKGSTNSRAITSWREAVYLSRLLGEKPEPGLFSIAQKAKFSQYTLEEDALAPFGAYIEKAQNKLRRKPLLQRLVYRLLFAAY